MSQDIDYIKKEIRKCEEVISPFDLKKGDIVRYITLDNGVEYFYDGGEYIGMSENRIQLKGKNVPIVFMNNEGEVLYRTRFFVKNDNEMSGGINIVYDSDLGHTGRPSPKFENLIITEIYYFLHYIKLNWIILFQNQN